MKLKTIIFGVVAILASTNVKASLITHNGYQLNENTNIITNLNTGVEWLQWDMTMGLSLTEALTTIGSTYDGGGWALASNAQMTTLFNELKVGNKTDWNAEESNSEFINVIYDSNNPPSITLDNIFISLFGITRTIDDLFGIDGLQSFSSRALFGDDANGNGVYNSASFNAIAGPLDSPDRIIGVNEYILSSDSVSGNDENSSPWALVRTTAVPEPGTLVVFLCGLMLVVRTRLNS